MYAVIRIETEQPGQLDPEPGDVARRRLGREPARVLLIQAVEVFGVREQHTDLDDIVEVGAAGLEDGLAVCERLARLILDRVSGKAAGARVDADDA